MRSTATEPAPAPVSAGPWQVPRLRRRGRVIGGVAGGLADEIGVDAVVVRIAFVVLAAAGGWGVALYLVTWLVLAVLGRDLDPEYRPEPKGSSEGARLAGVGLVTLGLLLVQRELGGVVDSVVWPLAVLGAGLALANHRGVALGGSGEDDRGAFLVRLGSGLVLVVAGVLLAVSLNFDLVVVRDTVLAMAVVLAGVVLVLGPWVLATVRDLGEERRRRIRSDERAEVAAHLHDSVLQTLALIQRRASDPEVVLLARRQERELRGWLFGGAPAVAAGFRARLAADLAGVEQRERVAVEVVVVGKDVPVDDRVDALLGAVREAATNAARHGGVDRVDVFAEVGEGSVEVFVRDQGGGFVPADVPVDRRGVAESIVGRMERAGGSALVHSAPGEGTEVELRLPLEAR